MQGNRFFGMFALKFASKEVNLTMMDYTDEMYTLAMDDDDTMGKMGDDVDGDDDDELDPLEDDEEDIDEDDDLEDDDKM